MDKQQLRFAIALLGIVTGPIMQAQGALFTAQQAEKGKIVFNNHCAECHRPDLTGAMGPALTGPTFHKTWNGKTVQDLFNFEHKKMPATNPGSVPLKQDWLITSFILEKNGLKPGNTELGPKAGGQILDMK